MKFYKKGLLLLLPLLCGSCDTISAMRENQEAIRTSTCVIEESSRLSMETNRLIGENIKNIEMINQKLKETTGEETGKGE